MPSIPAGPVMLSRRSLLLAGGGAALLAACGAPAMRGTYDLEEVQAPPWRNGQSWTWQRTDSFTKLQAGTITRTIAGREGNVIRVRESLVGAPGPYGEAAYASPGVMQSGVLSDFGPVFGRMDPLLPLYLFPLQSGKTWGWRGSRTDPNGFRTPMSMSARVEGWETVQAAGRSYKTVIVSRTFDLGPPDPFRGPLSRYETEWYAPELGGPVRSHSEEYYYETRGNFMSRAAGYRYDLILTGATPGG